VREGGRERGRERERDREGEREYNHIVLIHEKTIKNPISSHTCARNCTNTKY